MTTVKYLRLKQYIFIPKVRHCLDIYGLQFKLIYLQHEPQDLKLMVNGNGKLGAFLMKLLNAILIYFDQLLFVSLPST